MRLISFVQLATVGLVVSLAVSGIPSLAEAGPFVVRTSRPEYPANEVSRPLIVEKEWLELDLTFDHKNVSQFTDGDGNVKAADYLYTRSLATLNIRYGFTSRWNLTATVPYVTSTTLETAAGVQLADRGLGDIRFGADWEFYRRRTPDEKVFKNTSGMARFWTKQASGSESRGAVGDPHIVLGTGTTDLGALVALKQQLPMSAVTVRAGYVHKFSDVVQFVFDETEGGGLNGRFKPGDEFMAGATIVIQPDIPLGDKRLGLIGLKLDADYSIRGDVMVGPTSNDFFGASAMEVVPRTGGSYLDVAGSVLLEPTRNWTVAFGVSIPVASTNSDRLWPLEAQNQSYGISYIGNVRFRW